MKYIIYKITRDDGQLYIGTTYREGFTRRMTAHKKTERFKDHTFDVDIVEESDDYDHIQRMEERYIEEYDSYHNGLNESSDGKGNHHAPTFTTKNYKFSDESRRKMSESAKKRIKRDGVPFKGCKHTKETKEALSKKRKGIRYSKTKLTEDDVIQILDDHHNKPHIDGVGLVMGNGRKMSYNQAFSKVYGQRYGVTAQCIRLVIEGKSWKDVKRK